jgi:hypothetical protein
MSPTSIYALQECESVFRSLFSSAANSAASSVSKSEITVTELPEQIKQGSFPFNDIPVSPIRIVLRHPTSAFLVHPRGRQI